MICRCYSLRAFTPARADRVALVAITDRFVCSGGYRLPGRPGIRVAACSTAGGRLYSARRGGVRTRYRVVGHRPVVMLSPGISNVLGVLYSNTSWPAEFNNNVRPFFG